MEKDMDGGASTVRSVRVVVLKKSSNWAKGIGLDKLEAEHSVDALILTCGHERWVVTKRKRMQIQQVPGVHLLHMSGLAQPENSLRNSDTKSQGISGFNQYVLTTKWINNCSVISLGLYFFFIHLTSDNYLFLCLWFLRTGFGCWLPNWECLRLASLIKNQQWGDRNRWFLARNAERDVYQICHLCDHPQTWPLWICWPKLYQVQGKSLTHRSEIQSKRGANKQLSHICF